MRGEGRGGGRRRRREDAAGETPPPPPASPSPEEPPRPPRPSERRRGWRAGSGGSELWGGAGRSRPPPSLPPSMGAGASRPPQPPEEGEPRRAVTSELGLSSHLGRARQDCCSRWPSTYQLAVRQVRDAFVLGRPRTNLGWRGRRATQRGHLAGGLPGERAPRGRRRKERAASGACGRFPEEFGARGQREEGERGSGPDLCGPPLRKPGCPVPSHPAGVGARRYGWVTWWCAW